MNTPLHVERRLLANAATPHSIYQVRTSAGETRTFKVNETRNLLAPSKVELEQRDDGSVPMIRGYAAVFDRESHDLGGFTEVMARGAFRRALDDPSRNQDTRALFNHDPNMVLASIRNNTLDLREDPQGLHYYAQPADTSYARDVRELIRRGDVYQSSFAFTVERDRWEEREDGTILRTILEIGSLYDVSPVTYPAYPQTTTSAREDAAPVEPRSEEPVDQEERAAEAAVASDDQPDPAIEERKARNRELVAGAKRALTDAKRRSLGI